MKDHMRAVCRWCVVMLLLMTSLWSCYKYELIGYQNPIEIEAKNIDIKVLKVKRDGQMKPTHRAKIPASGIETALTFPEYTGYLPGIEDVRVNGFDIEYADFNEDSKQYYVAGEWGSICSDMNTPPGSINIIVDRNDTGQERIIRLHLRTYTMAYARLELIQKSAE